MFDLWLNRYTYDKICDSNLKICFPKFMPCICLIHLRLFRFYNSTIEWKEITPQEKSREEKVWFPKMNDLSNFVTDLHFLENQIIVTSAVGGSWSVEFVISCFSDCPFLFAIFCIYCCFVLRWYIWSVLSLSDWRF